MEGRRAATVGDDGCKVSQQHLKNLSDYAVQWAAHGLKGDMRTFTSNGNIAVTACVDLKSGSSCRGVGSCEQGS